jgi:hypothetical protein
MDQPAVGAVMSRAEANCELCLMETEARALRGPGGMQGEGQSIVWGIDAVAELAECVEEFGLGAFAHAWDTVEVIGAVAEAEERGEESGGGAGVADEDFERVAGGAGVWDLSAETVNDDLAVGGVMGVWLDLEVEPEALQGRGHDLGIFAPECALEGDGLGGEGSQGEGAVCDAFGAGEGDGAARGCGGRDDFYERGQGHGWEGAGMDLWGSGFG